MDEGEGERELEPYTIMIKGKGARRILQGLFVKNWPKISLRYTWLLPSLCNLLSLFLSPAQAKTASLRRRRRPPPRYEHKAFVISEH